MHNPKHSTLKLINHSTMKLPYKTFLYRLIQLVSIVFLPVLAQSRAEQAAATAEPPLRLEVGSARPVGSERAIQVTLSNASSVVVDPARYRLVYREKNGKPLSIRCYNTTGKPTEVAPEQLLPLTALLGTEMLPTGKGSNKTFTLILMPGKGVRQAELALSIEDAQGSIVSEPLFVTWRAKPFWTTQEILAGGAVLASAVLVGLIWHFRGSQPPAGPSPDRAESSTRGCPKPEPQVIGGKTISPKGKTPLIVSIKKEENCWPRPQFPPGLGREEYSGNHTPQPHAFARFPLSPEEFLFSNRDDANTAPKLVRSYSWPPLPKDDDPSALGRRFSSDNHLSVTPEFFRENTLQSSTSSQGSVPQRDRSPSTEDAYTASLRENTASSGDSKPSTSSPPVKPNSLKRGSSFGSCSIPTRGTRNARCKA